METNSELSTTEQVSILEDIQESYHSATTGKRFANYLIDFISFYAIFFLIGIIVAIVSPQSISMLDDDSVSFKIMDRVITTLCYGLYMSIIEGLFKGKTLGKLITKTKAVNGDGTEITWQTAFKRGFSRIVPFETLSGLSGYPWHDKWTDTYVVDEKKW
jgi:uncharacterized RDD family membrane protein YckC